MQSDALSEIVDNLEGVALAAVRTQQPVHAAQVLAFLTKVAQVVDQAYSDVLALLIDIRFLDEKGLHSGELRELHRRTAQLMNKSHFRDAEEICSRLSTLKEIYLSQISQYVAPNGAYDWSGLFGLIEEREGRIVMMIQDTLWTLDKLLDQTTSIADLPRLRDAAAEKIEPLKQNLAELKHFTSRILGLSGEPGLLEMLRSGQNAALVVGEISVMVDKRQQHDYRTGDNSIILGAGASARDIHLEQKDLSKGIDLVQLAEQLKLLRAAMRIEGTGDADEDAAIGAIAAAEKAARDGDSKGVFAALKTAGKWSFSVAEKISVGLVVAALKPMLGMTG